MGLVYGFIAMTLMCLMALLAVDVGRVHMARSQLRGTTDAAALAAAADLVMNVPSARRTAMDLARENVAAGAPVVLQPKDVVAVVWDTKKQEWSMPVGSQKPNAVMVTAHRTRERGNSIATTFGKAMGAADHDVTVTSIALARPTRYALIGLDFVHMTGNSTTSYKTKGSYASGGSVASNGDIRLSGSSFVDGNAYPGIGRAVFGSGHVTGSTNPLVRPLVFPQADPGDAAYRNDNAVIDRYLRQGVLKAGSQASIHVPAGTYYLTGLDLGAGAALNLSGDVTIYVAGDVALGGHAEAGGSGRFKLVVLGTGRRVRMSGNSELHLDLYAPGAAIEIVGNVDIFGAVVGQSVSTTGSGVVHFDRSLTGGALLVK